MNILLNKGEFYSINKDLLAHLGCVESCLFLAYLIEKEFKKGEFFPLKSSDLQTELWFSYRAQKKCINLLKETELIDTKLIGIPCKLNFKINHTKLAWVIL